MYKRVLSIIVLVMLLLSGCAAQSHITQQERDTFNEAKQYLQNELNELQETMKGIGQSIGDNPSDEQAYTLLNEKLNSKEYFFDIVVCDKDTNILNVATKFDASWIGLNLDSIDRMDELFVDEPVFLVKPLESSDGTPFIYCSVPIDKAGWVIAYIDPFSFGATLSSLSIGENVDFGVMDTNGTNVYSSNMTEIGKNILADELYADYEDLLNLVKNQIIPKAQGKGAYTFHASGMGSSINKNIEWDTVQAFDKELRIYVNTEQGGESSSESAKALRDFNEDELEWMDSATAMVKDTFSELLTLNESAVKVYGENGEDSEEFGKALEEISKISKVVRSVYYINTEKIISRAYPAYFEGTPWDTIFASMSNLEEYGEDPFFIPPVVNSDHDADSIMTAGFGYPVIENGETKGWIVSMGRVYEIAAYMTNLQSLGKDVNFMLVNNDGLVIYDGDISEVGKNLLEDDLYKNAENLQEFITNELMKDSEGDSEYEFYGSGMTEPIRKHIVWTTVDAWGNDFKFSMNSEWHE